MKLLEKYCQHLVKVGKKFPLKVQNKDKLFFTFNISFVLTTETLSLIGLIFLTIVHLANWWSIEENQMKLIWLFFSVNFSVCMLAVLFINKILNPYLEKYDL